MRPPSFQTPTFLVPLVFLCALDTPVVASHFKFVKNEEAKDANRSTSRKEGDYSNNTPPTDGKIGGAKARRFKFDELVAATDSFKEDYFLGEGGFGKVYKGHLLDTGEVSSTTFLCSYLSIFP